MPYISNATAQSLSALVRTVLNKQNEAINEAREIMQEIKRVEKTQGEKCPKVIKDLCWKNIYKESQKLKRNAELQVWLKGHLSKAQD